MNDFSRYRIVPVELVVGAPGFADLEEAIGAATLKARGDRAPRVVIQVLAEVCSEVEPAVVLTRFGEPLERG